MGTKRPTKLLHEMQNKDLRKDREQRKDLDVHTLWDR